MNEYSNFVVFSFYKVLFKLANKMSLVYIIYLYICTCIYNIVYNINNIDE